MARVVPGLEVFLAEEAERWRDARLGLVCNPTAVDRHLDHALRLLDARGLEVVRVFGPEHGALSTAQDMVGVDGETLGRREVVTLYGHHADSLRPRPEHLADLDAVLFDIQDIGARYYTYQATLGYLLQVAAGTGTPVVVLDRPNPINGTHLEGNVVEPGFESFVSAWPLAIRHGMTVGELGTYFCGHLGMDADLQVVPCRGWSRDQWFDQTGLPWVLPSPNMPTPDTATLYPGMCLLEGTNLSEGRGTTRPFHLFGAPWLDPEGFCRLLRKGAEDAGLQGVGFRAASFLPQFQKHAGVVCGGAEVHLNDRHALDATLLGLVVLEAALRADPDRFAWRTDTYEFVDEPIAIDLLGGSAELRTALELRMPPAELVDRWAEARADWEERRAACLLY